MDQKTIETQAKLYCPDSTPNHTAIQGAFTVAAEWAVKQAKEEIIGRAAQWLMDHIGVPGEVETTEDGEPLAMSYIEHAKRRIEVANEIIEDFKNFMREE